VRVAPARLADGNGGIRRSPAAGTLLSAGAARGEVEHALLSALENPRDGYLDRLLHRHLSRPLTRLLLRTPLSANVITVAGVLLGMFGGVLIGVPGPLALVAGVACLVLSGVLDCSDGELARLRFAESRLGHLLDVGGDTLVHLTLLGGIAARAAHAGARPSALVLGALALGALGAFAAISWSERHEARRRRAGGWESAVLDHVLAPLTTRDWYVFPLAFALLGRLDLRLPAAAVGAHLFWMTTALLELRVRRRAH
jgi:phosphatidylglycerophosphate synthase